VVSGDGIDYQRSSLAMSIDLPQDRHSIQSAREHTKGAGNNMNSS